MPDSYLINQQQAASKETYSTSNISPELVDEEDYDDLLMQPVHLSMYDANEEEVHAVPDEMIISNTVESEQEADTDAPPPTPQETNEDPAISDKPSIKFSPINTVPATNVRRPTKERTPFRRERKNEKFAYIKVRVITSHGRIPEISIRNKYQLKAQSVCRRHHIVVSGAGSHICIDCRKETFDEKDYICNRALGSSLGKFSYRTNQRNGIFTKSKRTCRSKRCATSNRGKITCDYISAMFFKFAVDWVIPPLLIVIFLLISDYIFIVALGK